MDLDNFGWMRMIGSGFPEFVWDLEGWVWLSTICFGLLGLDVDFNNLVGIGMAGSGF